MEGHGNRAVIYTRLSKDKGKSKGKAGGSDTEGLGVARQEKACHQLASARGWTVVKVYSDNDTSAWSGVERPDYAAMLSDAAKGRFDHIVAWAPDRLARNLMETLEFGHAIAAAGVRAWAVTSGQVGTESENEFMSTVLQGMLGQVESDRRSKRVREKMLEKARNGEPHGGTRGYGYTIDMKVIPAEAKVIREAATRLLGGEGISSVVNDFNGRGIPGGRGKAGVWTTSTLKTIMCSPRIAGLRRHLSRPKGETNKGGLFREGDLYAAKWDENITLREWERLRAKLDSQDRRRPSPAREFPLTGLLICGRCGGRLVGYRYTDGQRGYACRSGMKGKNCGRCTTKAEPTETYILGEVRAAIMSGALADRLTDHAGADLPAAIAEVQARREDLTGLAEDYGNGLMTRAEYLAAREPMVARREAAETRLEALEAASGPTPPIHSLREWDRAWRQASSASAQAALLGSVLERVTVGPGTPGRRFQRERFTLTWRG